jgi:Tfp pilus assembly protein PilF
MALRQNLELMLQRGQDSPLLRFSLGSECLKEGDLVAAIDHLRHAVELNPGYSAAWKVLGQAYTRTGAGERAVEAYRQGIAAATGQGDMQAAREMTVFLKRLASQRKVSP